MPVHFLLQLIQRLLTHTMLRVKTKPSACQHPADPVFDLHSNDSYTKINFYPAIRREKESLKLKMIFVTVYNNQFVTHVPDLVQ